MIFLSNVFGQLRNFFINSRAMIFLKRAQSVRVPRGEENCHFVFIAFHPRITVTHVVATKHRSSFSELALRARFDVMGFGSKTDDEVGTPSRGSDARIVAR